MTANLIKAAGDDSRSGTTAQDLLNTLGEEVFNKLRQHFSGQEISIPKWPADGHPLVLALGREDVDFVCDEFYPMALYIPKSGDRFSARIEFIRRALANGVSRSEISKSLDISSRWLRQLVRDHGLAGCIGPDRGKSPHDVAAEVADASYALAEFDDASISRFTPHSQSSPHGIARRNRVMNAAEKTDRRICDTSTSVVRPWDHLFRCYVNSEITQSRVVTVVGINHMDFKRLLERFRATGTIVPASILARPAVPVGGQTGLPAIKPQSTSEHRASGL